MYWYLQHTAPSFSKVDGYSRKNLFDVNLDETEHLVLPSHSFNNLKDIGQIESGGRNMLAEKFVIGVGLTFWQAFLQRNMPHKDFFYSSSQ